ncbi:DUF4175 family protein [Mucilaginibacter sp. E4BP6]|uniref:DUF4175 family protein n=1 Tax=Mucilaginibacter sp. E4BP6 TaxID=2723089 RepID=UPI0015CCF869|nr:DUF4175 family protein [Mucilaginibacter sp. E4BP6]NYE64822.1 hypothetical protein [Mucilaginibacter sp. E4BP6]
MNSTENYELLISKINTFIRKYYLNNLLRGLIFLGAGLFSAYVVITLSEYFGNFNTAFRTILFYAFILLNLGLIVWLVIPSLFAWLKLSKNLTHDEAAAIIGKHFGHVNDKLLNTLQLKKQALVDEKHRALIEASIDQKIELLKPVSFPSAINIRENNRYLKWIITPVAIICVLALAAPSILTESTKRLIRHNEYFAPVSPFQFEVQNHSLSVVQGQDFKLDLKLTGDKFPADVYIETAGNTFKLDKENIARFHYIFSNLQQNQVFKLTANGFTSAPYQIIVNLRPSLLHFDVELKYPAYLHKKNEAIANAGDLTIPAGTTVSWAFHTQNATGLYFSLGDKTQLLNPAKNDVFEHTERIIENTRYKINPLNTVVKNADSASYRIGVIADEPPTINVDEKPDSVSTKAIYFNGKIQDDHGFSSLVFYYKIGTDKNARTFSKPVKADLNQTQSGFFYYWNLKEIGIKPGQQVSYCFEVADNDAVNGPQKVRSAEHTLNVPDAAEITKQLNNGTEAVKQKMQSAIKLAGQVERESQKLNELLLNKNNLSFDEKKQIADLMQKKKDLDDLVKQIQDENHKNEFNRQENLQQDPSITEKQKEMEKLFNNVLDPKTQQLLQNLQQLLQQDQKDATRDDLSKMQSDNKSLKKELDRMLELYKKLAFNQKLDQNIKQLNQLAQEQQKLAGQTKQPGTDPKSAQQQQQKLNDDFQELKKSLDELNKENEQNDLKMDFENPAKEEKNIDQEMQQSSDDLKKNNSQKASQSQQQAAKQLQQMADKMQQQNQEGEDNQSTIDIQQLRQLLKNLINSSFEQESVMQTLKTTNTTDPIYIALAQKQKDIKDNLKTAEDSLYAISRRVPQIQSTVNKEIGGINDHIDQALQNLGDRQIAEAGSNQQYAMTAMNNLALMLSEALEQLQKAKNGSGKGKSKQQTLGELAKMQQQLNQNMQKAREQMQKEGKQEQSGQKQGQGSSMSEQLARMAREQQMIRETLQQINQEDNKDGTHGLGNLDKISQQMEQNERDLVNKHITDEALKRQEQIQTRLLEAEKAEQQRDQDQKRESNTGRDMPPGYIKALQDYQQVKVKQTEQIKTESPALNLYYKQKINIYFDQINAK